jgi:CheY-like chemotaxis protein
MRCCAPNLYGISAAPLIWLRRSLREQQTHARKWFSTGASRTPGKAASPGNQKTELRLPGLNGAAAPWVLVVDDEVLVREFVELALVEAGFDVLAVVRKEALATLNEQAAALRALITDIGVGPGISGWDIASHARELQPRVPVVYLSGYGAEDWPAQGVPDSLMLQKPVTSDQVVAAVSEVLNRTHT